MPETPEEGAVYRVERTFTAADVERFAAVSKDTQPRHVDPESGPPMVHGLLTATLLTEIGGDLEVLAHTMDLSFRRPVYAGDTVTCTWTTGRVTERAGEDRVDIVADVVCRNASGETVLSATVEGVVETGDGDD
jgi:acyl dehydratase